MTLAEARVMSLSLPEPHQANPHWQHTAGMLAESKSAIDDAQTQLLRALNPDG
jgi:hypothetical protein